MSVITLLDYATATEAKRKTKTKSSISDTATNSLILYGTADDFVLVKRVVEVLDVPEARAKP